MRLSIVKSGRRRYEYRGSAGRSDAGGFSRNFCSRRALFSSVKKQIEENGIETIGTISRVVDDRSQEEIKIQVYARYRSRDGKEIEGVLTNAPPNLFPGQKVRLKCHQSTR